MNHRALTPPGRHSPAIVAALLAMLSGTAYAVDPPGFPASIEAFDAREIAMLPRYCKYTQVFENRVPGGHDAAEQERLRTIMGNTFYAMHHYCLGLMNTNRARLSRTQQYREFYLRTSITEFDYVIERAPADFVVLPEIVTRKGENLIRLGRGDLGARELERAIELKPDYWPPYAALGDYYKAAGSLGKARDVLQKGLALSPDAKALKARLSALGSARDNGKRAE